MSSSIELAVSLIALLFSLAYGIRKKNKTVINIDKVLLGEVTGATEVDILERPTTVNSATVKGNTVTAALPAFGITTVKISLNR